MDKSVLKKAGGISRDREYSLDNENEVDRLEFQATIPFYNPKKEIQKLKLPDNSTFLDAGCGSGIISRYISNKFQLVSVDACDISKTRLLQAQTLNNHNNKVNFFHSSLEKIKSPQDKYDFIFCRFVLEHMINPQNAVNEFFRINKLNGRVLLIDLDGIFFNLYSNNKELNKTLHLLKREFDFDLFIGRKLPLLLSKAGYKNIKYKVEVMYFKGRNLKLEYQNYLLRFKFIEDILVNILGNTSKTNDFIDLYLKELLKSENTLFYNKFIVSGNKK